MTPREDGERFLLLPKLGMQPPANFIQLLPRVAGNLIHLPGIAGDLQRNVIINLLLKGVFILGKMEIRNPQPYDICRKFLV